MARERPRSDAGVRKKKPREKKANGFFEVLGPGLITGAADDDPSGIATYSQVGARFGFGLLWTLLFSFPMMFTVQEIAARIGRITGKGLAANMTAHYPGRVTFPLVALLVAANIFNLGADIAAMGSALQLIVGGPALLFGVLFAILSLGLQVFVPYSAYSRYLKWLTLVLLAYVATVLAVHVPWGEALRHTFLPSFPWSREGLEVIAAVLGTTISPYLFFWQASTEVEDVRRRPTEKPLKKAPHQAGTQFRRIRLDTLIGMAASNLVAFFIMLTAAVTLHAHGKTDIGSAAEAAEALRPVAGPFAFTLFSMGIIGTGLLALPVLAGSAAYAVGEAFHWPTGLQQKPWQAKRFYAVIAAAMILSVGIVFSGLDPIKALVLSAAINGVVSAPILILLMVMSGNRRLMGEFRISRPMTILGWITTGFMGAVAVALFASFLW